MNRHREPARITRVFYGREDHGCLICRVDLGDDGGCRGVFGSFILDEKTGPDFLAVLCEAFGVSDREHLVGIECYALRAFEWGDIEGLEAPSGRRFTITGWRRRHWPDAKSPLDRERQRLRDGIEHARRKIADRESDLSTIESRYVDCEAPVGTPSIESEDS